MQRDKKMKTTNNLESNSDKSNFAKSKKPNRTLWKIYFAYCVLLGIIAQIIQSFILNYGFFVILLSGLISGLVLAIIPIIIASLHRFISKKESSRNMFVLFYIISTLEFLSFVNGLRIT